MNSLMASLACVIAVSVVGCAAEANGDADGDAMGSTDSELRSQLGANDAIRCTVKSKPTVLALVPTKAGKAALLTLKPAADLFALSRNTGTLSTPSTGLAWRNSAGSLTLNADLKGTWESGAQSANVTCAKVAAAEAASWRTANALSDYADGIDGIADAILEDAESGTHPKPYTVFAVETANRGSLSLGRVVAQTAGSLSAHSDEDDSLLDEDDFGQGAMSAAYSLGGGDDYGEWFQAVSDGVSLIDSVRPALGPTAVAGFIAREKVSALSTPVGTQNPSAVEITVGSWTFFLPDSFAE